MKVAKVSSFDPENCFEYPNDRTFLCHFGVLNIFCVTPKLSRLITVYMVE